MGRGQKTERWGSRSTLVSSLGVEEISLERRAKGEDRVAPEALEVVVTKGHPSLPFAPWIFSNRSGSNTIVPSR